MNRTKKSIHRIPSLPSFYIDAFETHRDRTSDPNAAFVLTHYHADHYTRLPRDGKYAGPARIHCTSITASLLRNVHGVDGRWIVEHGYGETWTFTSGGFGDDDAGGTGGGGGEDDKKENVHGNHRTSARSAASVSAEVTFYDANHCPGAAIVFVHVLGGSCGDGNNDNDACHLHCGDMRYHEKMKSYPLLREAVRQKRLDVVLLDTTYSHPKHDFGKQEASVDEIASVVQRLLLPSSGEEHGEDDGNGGRVGVDAGCKKDLRGGHEIGDEAGNDFDNGTNVEIKRSPSRTLVLLSCYSIGKEKVLLEASRRSRQLLYVDERKHRMILSSCCRSEKGTLDENGHGEHGDDDNHTRDNDGDNNDEENYDGEALLKRCTRDANKSDLHVIPMGMAGQVWPYFQPNYQKCAEYARKCSMERQQMGIDGGGCDDAEKYDYEKVVAFMPTGWSEASNWNKKNAVSRKRVVLEDDDDDDDDEDQDMEEKEDGSGGTKKPFEIDVEVRLVGYSEHSSFEELRTFVEFLRPRKIVPTVFSGGDAGYIAVERRFRDLVDDRRAKMAFFRGMTKATTTVAAGNTAAKKIGDRGVGTMTANNETIIGANEKSTDSSSWECCAVQAFGGNTHVLTTDRAHSCRSIESDPSPTTSTAVAVGATKRRRLDESIVVIDVDDDDTDEEKKETPSSVGCHRSVEYTSESKKKKANMDSDNATVALLVSMGFNPEASAKAASRHPGNVDAAVNFLLSDNSSTKCEETSSSPTMGTAATTLEHRCPSDGSPSALKSKSETPKNAKTRKITNFFSPR